MSTHDRELLLLELRYLRKGRGATFSKLVASPVLMSVLDEPADPLTELRRQIERLGEDEQVKALLVALGYARTERTLTDRRNGFAWQTEKHPDTIETWENSMIEELATRLLRSGKAVQVEASDDAWHRWYSDKQISDLIRLVASLPEYDEDQWDAQRTEQDRLNAEVRAAAAEMEVAEMRHRANGSQETLDAFLELIHRWQHASVALARHEGFGKGRTDFMGQMYERVDEILPPDGPAPQ